MTDPEQPGDPVLRAVAASWDDIQRHADPRQRKRLAALVAGMAEPDADEARAALADELLDILPPDHPVSQLLRATPMYSDEPSARSEAELADDLRRLSTLVSAGSLAVPAAAAAVSGDGVRRGRDRAARGRFRPPSAGPAAGAAVAERGRPPEPGRRPRPRADTAAQAGRQPRSCPRSSSGRPARRGRSCARSTSC